MDYKIHRVNGHDTAAQIKADQSITRTPYLFLISSYHRDEIFDRHPKADVIDAFLSKPISESRLFDALAQVLNGKTKFTVPQLNRDKNTALVGGRGLLVADDKVNQLVQ